VPERLSNQSRPQAGHCDQQQQGADEHSGSGQAGVHLRFLSGGGIDYNLVA